MFNKFLALCTALLSITDRVWRKLPRLFWLMVVISTGPGILAQGKPSEPDVYRHPPPMAADAHPAFEVATVKPSSPPAGRGNVQLGAHNIRIDNQSVLDLIAFAYSLHKEQIIGGPRWLDEAHFDIQGQPDILGIPDLQQVQEMTRKLLVERFGLAFHFGDREMSVFVMTAEKAGAKLHASDSKSNLPSETGLPSESGSRSRKFTNCSMGELAQRMQSYLSRPVIDETHLQGRYDFALTWIRDDALDAGTNGAAGLFTAIREQLGLRFEPRQANARVMQIDRVTRPAEN